MKSFSLVWVWPVLISAAGLSVLVFGYIPSDISTGVSTVLQIFLSILIAYLASLIASRQPGHRIASLLYVTSVGVLLLVASSLPVEFGQVPQSPTFLDYAASWLFNFLGSVILYPLLLILYMFPTGHFLTRRWSVAAWAVSVFSVALGFAVLFSEEVGMIFDPDSERWHLVNPIGFLAPEVAEFMLSSAVGVMMWLAIGGVAAMITRYRRADTLVRTQIKWVVYASAVAAIALASTSLSAGNPAVFLAQALTALAVIPIAITIAIIRFKLFEIDRLISRTVTYGLVVALLGGMFALLTWLPSFLIGGVGDDGEGSAPPPVIIAASTLAVAALFNPLRRRIQHSVDRRFNRSGYQAELVSEGFAATLSESLSTEEIMDFWKLTVQDAVQPQAAGIWLKED